MKRYIVVLQLLLLVLFMSGCAQKVTIRALEPAEIDRAAKTKKIAVTYFDNDYAGLSTKIEANLARHTIDSKPFFTMLGRNDIKKIIKEQKLQNSGLVDISSAVDVGNLIGAQAIISGNVGDISSSDTFFYESRSRCADKKCKEYVYYNVRCKKREVSLSAEIRMVDVAKGDIIYAESFSKSSVDKHCSDDSHPLLSQESAAQNLADSIANDFTYKLKPHYRYFSVELLEDADLDYDEKQEGLLESALEYIKYGRYDKAESLLISLIDSTNQKSYVAFYNLGVVKEAQGEYMEAREYYEKAESLADEPVEVVSNSYTRINSLIRKHQKTKEQMGR